MQTQYFHGKIEPIDIGRALIARFNRGNLRAQQFGNDRKVIIQIATRDQPVTGGQTAITVSIEKIEDGISVQLGKQAWLGVAASLGMTALSAWHNPWSLLSRIDDVAQDIEYLQLNDQIQAVITGEVEAAGASYELSDRLRRLVCSYCYSANPVGESNCVACGAPLGSVQPTTCKYCGFAIRPGEVTCPNCGKELN